MRHPATDPAPGRDAVPAPSAEDVARWNEELEGAPPLTVLAWAAARFGGSIAASSSFQTQSVPLLHMISRAAPDTPVLFLDTGYHFPETLAFRDRLARELGLRVRSLHPLEGHDALVRRHGDLHRRDPDACCWMRKVEPLERAKKDYRAWIRGVRRDQTADRAATPVIDATPDGLVRVAPMAAWTERDMFRYLHDHGLPEHPLLQQGYLSIGCAPCTRAVRPGEDARAGRWAGNAKTECGLHLDATTSTGPERS